MQSRHNLIGEADAKKSPLRRVVCGALIAGIFSGSCLAECKPPASLQAKLQSHPGASTYANLGSWYGERHEFDCANEAFRAGLSIDPSSAQLQYFLGLSLYSSGQVEASLGPLKKSTALYSAAVQPRLLLASALRQLGRKQEAEAQWQAILKLDGDSTAALDGLSNTLVDDGEPNAAIDLLLAAKGRGAVNADLALDLARAYGVAEMLDDAAATVKEALEKDPQSSRLTNALATVYVRQKRFQEAEALMKVYLGRHAGEIEAQILYLRILVLNENHEKAIPLGRRLLVRVPHNFDVLYLNGILERENGEHEQARHHLREAVELKSGDYSARYNYGAALLQVHDAAGAKEQLEKAISLDASRAEAHFQLALALRSLGATDSSEEQMRLYQDLSKVDTARAEAATASQIAAQKLAAGDIRQALASYRQALAATPEDPRLNYQYAMVLRQAGDADAERAALEQAVKLDPTFALAQNELGYLVFRAGGFAAAEVHFRRAVQSAPAFTDAWINLAATLASEGHLPEAREAVASALQSDPKNGHALQLAQDLTAADPAAKAGNP